MPGLDTGIELVTAHVVGAWAGRRGPGLVGQATRRQRRRTISRSDRTRVSGLSESIERIANKNRRMDTASSRSDRYRGGCVKDRSRKGYTVSSRRRKGDSSKRDMQKGEKRKFKVFNESSRRRSWKKVLIKQVANRHRGFRARRRRGSEKRRAWCRDGR